MRIIVTGGAGFIGSHVVDRLVSQGRELMVVDDLSTGKREYVDKTCEFEKVSITDFDKISDLIRSYKPNMIVNFAVKCLLMSFKEPKVVNETNVGGVINMLELIKNTKREIHFVQISSSEVYGTALRVPQTEDHPVNPTTPYGASKAAADVYVKSYHVCYKIPVTIIRPFNCYGPRMRTDSYCNVIYSFFKRLSRDKDPVIFGDGLQTRDFTYIDDTAKGIISAISCKDLIGHVVHIATGKEIRIIDIARLSNKLFGRGPEKIIFRQERKGDVRRHLADISRAQRLLGYRPSVGIEEGLRRTFEWLEDAYSANSAG